MRYAHDSCCAGPGTRKVERNHQFSKFLDFGGEGGLKTNSPADQEKAIVYNELVANAVAAQTVNDLTHALNKLHDRGINIAAEDLAHFSPYPTSKVKRFGDDPAQVITDARPIQKHLPASSRCQWPPCDRYARDRRNRESPIFTPILHWGLSTNGMGRSSSAPKSACC
jgi:hypothetical protein